MKKLLRKSLSILLAVIMILASMPMAFAAETKAAEYDGQIDGDVKQHRAEIINEQQAVIMQTLCENHIGETLDVLVEGYDRYAECYFGRSRLDAPEVDPCVFFTISDVKPQSGDMVKVKITDYLDCDLVGEMEA